MSHQELEQAKSERAERERVITAVNFGAALQDLIVHARLEKNGPDATPRRWGGAQFPPDLEYRINPETLLRNTCRKLLNLEETLLRLLKLEETLLRPEQHRETRQRQHQGQQAAPGTEAPGAGAPGAGAPGAEAPGVGALPAPSKQLTIKEKIDQLIAFARSNPHSKLESHLLDIDEMICKWDALIVERIVDFPAVFSGYRAGKALSMTRWKIWEAKRWNTVDGNPYIDPWREAFSRERIDEIKRHVSSLSTVLDPQAVAVVTTSLGYWRESLLALTSSRESSEVLPRARWRRVLHTISTFIQKISTIRESPSTIRKSSLGGSAQASEIAISSKQGERLRTALDEQITTWLDVLTGRRPLESFPIVGIVTALTKKMAATLWKKLIRFLIIIGISVAVLLVLGTLIAVAIMVLNDFRSGNRSLDWQGLLASIGTAFAAIFTFIVVQGRSLFDRGSDEDPRGMRNRGGQWGSYGMGGFMNVFWRSGYGARGSTGVPSLKQNALSNVVAQIQLEEYNLAVSDPLVRCFLALMDQKSAKGDPQEDAERFLRLVYGDRSNLDRLLPTFKDLYKH
jgi:hypothetical protein